MDGEVVLGQTVLGNPKKRRNYSSEISADHDEYPEVTQDDMDRSVFRVGLRLASSGKQQITIQLDTVLIEYFKSRAGETDYQRLINDMLRRVIREELHHPN